MHCLAVQKLPEGEGWEYGLKLDSYPTLAVKHNGRLTLFSPNKKSSNARFPGITAALDKLPDKSFVDGEVVAMDDSARPSFNRLQNFSKNAHAITFYAFDLLIWKDEDLRSQPLENRCELLRSKVMPTLSAIRYSDSFAVTAENIVAAVRSQGLAGVVAKRRDSRCESGRRAWVKMRIGGRQKFVIVRYSPGPKSFDALLVGYYEGDKLNFAVRVRSGFVPKTRETVFGHFKKLYSKKCPVANLPQNKKGR